MNERNDIRSMVFSASSLEQVKDRIQESLQQGAKPTLAIVFCSIVHQLEGVGKLFSEYGIDVFGATSAGEIADDKAYEGSIVAMLLDIAPDFYSLATFDAQGIASYQMGQNIAEWAKSVYDEPAFMVISAGLRADGEQIVNGIIDEMGSQTPLFGGLAGDDLRMQGTFVFDASQVIADGVVALIFDRNVIELQGVAVSGWRGVGTLKTVTRAEGNIIYTIDNQPALDVYSRYLNVTGSSDSVLAAEYPLLLIRDDGSSVLRSVMLINEDKSMVYAGTVPEGTKVRFSIPPGFEITDHALEQLSAFNQQIPEADAVVLFSCKARHLALGPMVESEISGVRKMWNVPLVGFFTYGEIGPTMQGRCDFHNDTLSLVLIQAKRTAMDTELDELKRIMEQLDGADGKRQTMLQLLGNLQKQISILELELDRESKERTTLSTLLSRTSEDLEARTQELEETMRQLRETQNQLIIREKMAALGSLVAGIAHEVNNPVCAVSSSADVSIRCINRIKGVLEISELADDVKEDIKLQRSLDILEENSRVTANACDRIAELVGSLRNFARLDEAEFQKADIHEGIDSTLTLVHHELRDKVNVAKEYGEISRIFCYPNQLNQVFMSLLLNAAQAIEDSGTIRIRTSADETNVYVEISDTGNGIPAKDLPRVFDPGFTTKSAGVGTGWGLSISYNIIQEHKGKINIESRVGEGTTVTIALPITQEGQ